ncbi:hypothetical protein CC80DRAFT_597044 [Byssothecium circinans]|uniref:Borealin N-terminal domain-containing protein n=1 Tax=Byssothecium circinans TaxID=147558 RepID=A0A6A5TM27_9PLEO|nr:hypothetical protein CC80DRAFT_597044 [Byssothecium circinans]
MSHATLSAEAKAAIRANLELELNARKEKLLAMCEAQCASLRSRLERRVNRIPASKRNMKLVDLLDASISAPAKVPAKTTTRTVKPAAARKEAPAPVQPTPAPVPTRAPNPAQPPAGVRKARAAPAKPVVKTTAAKSSIKAATTSTRGKKRPSDDGEKENVLDVPKKRAKTAAAPAPTPAPAKPAATRSTRAASRKAVPAVAAILSPKENYNHTAARSRRPR